MLKEKEDNMKYTKEQIEHAHSIIDAISEGKTIQRDLSIDESQWFDWKEKDMRFLLDIFGFEIRIKPEPKQ